MHLRGQIIDIPNQRIFPGVIEIADGKIVALREDQSVTDPGYLCPGFIDAHVHIESSMLTPPEFARIAVIHGTVGTVSDPHEIANVLGIEGVRYMQKLAAQTPCKIHFGIPSCVPATNFETAGATLGPEAIEELCRDESLLYLSEMMNFPGVIHRDPEVMKKIEIAKQYGKRIDGHAPGLRGEDLKKYVSAGIETDHECFQIDEAREKLALGQKILIREGSAAKNFEELWPLLHEAPESCMLCSDDKHPDDLMVGHINRLCARAVAHGVPLFNVLRAACVNPVEHYGLRCGLLRPGDPADLIRLHDLISFEVMETWIDGQLVARGGQSLLPRSKSPRVNHFQATAKVASDFALPAPAAASDPASSSPLRIRVIEALDGQIITGAGEAEALLRDGQIVANPGQDILKIVVVNRYKDAPPAVALVRGVGLKSGAIASSVAHDCHNIVAIGTSDEDLARVINLLIENEGGIAIVGDGGLKDVLPLPVAGLMSDGYAEDAATAYARLSQAAQALGSPLHAPYMTLSFLALLVIPALKLSDLGLFDGYKFAFVPVSVRA
ncbi:MAG: adenine deaminase [Verrucomicrobia bacterium]|nr:adenine deaminase [Verrucomicrobiota bacterium]MDA1203889.1 adenine deaminase [Verrucomicrobiota bacterium]